jgi:hypothetical protein
LGGTFTATGGATLAGTVNINTTGASAINMGTGDYSGNLTLGNTSANVSITDAQWSITGAGAATFVGVNATTGLIQGTGGLTLTGTTDINTSGAANTNIGTGTSTGTIIIGRTTGTNLVLNDAQWNISGAGAASFDSLTVGGGFGSTGVTVTTTGNIQADGNLTVNGTINSNTFTSTALTFAGSNPAITAGVTNTNLSLAANGTGTLILGLNSGPTVINGSNFSVTAEGAISAATSTNTINSLVINAGALSSVTGYSQAAGNFTVNGSGNVSLGTGTGNVAIGNSTGTFELASNGGLNVTTGGALTGVSTINTIGVTATSLSFAGQAAITAGGADNNLTLDAGGSGLVQIGNNSTGDVELAGGYTDYGCTIENATGTLRCSGDIIGSETGTIGYWSRDAATSTLRTATDWDNLTLGGTFTATGGATLAGTVNINTTGASATNIGTADYTGAINIGNVLADISLTSGVWNVTATGAATFVGVNATTGLIQGTGGLTLTGTTDINTTGTANTTIGNADGTFALASTGLNVSTAGELTGITGYSQESGDFTVNGTSIVSLGTGTGNVTIGNADGTFALASTGLNVSTAGVITLPGGQTVDITTVNDSDLTIAPGGAAALTLGSATTTSITLLADGIGDDKLVLPLQSVSAGEILNNTITTTQLAPTLTFEAGDFLDLSAINHSTSALQGLRLPNSANPVNPVSGAGFITYDTVNNRILFYNGTEWESLASGASSSKWTEDTDNNIIYPNTIGRNLSLTQHW